MTEQLIDLKLIKPNPYQPRTIDDPEHTKKLAVSIATDGVIQTPKARKCKNGTYELGYGHSRFLAVEFNRDAKVTPARYDNWTKMPLDIVELTDEEMYRYAITENVQRKDLNPIEIAKSMLVYRDQFKKTSEEIGQLFGYNASTVRGYYRLPNLPDPIQQKVGSGEIPQVAARKMVTYAPNLTEADLLEIVDDIEDGTSVDDAIEMVLRDKDNVVTMWESWRREEKPRGGSKLWPLATPANKFPAKYLPVMTVTEAAKIVSENQKPLSEHHDKVVIQGRINHFKNGGKLEQMPGYQVTVVELGNEQTKENYERLAHLINPPACTDCPFHVVLDRSHYCTLKPCHQRKTKAWITDELHRVSKKISIPIYDPATDGKVYVALAGNSYEDGYETHAKWMKDKDASLRVASHKSEYSAHKWTDSHFVRVIMVGDKATAFKGRKSNSRNNYQKEQEERERRWQLEQMRSHASTRFAREYAIAFFVPAFAEMTNIAVMCALAREKMPKKDAKKKDVLADLRWALAARALQNMDGWDYSLKAKGPTVTAKFLEKVAMTWGTKLPADFLGIAKGYEPAVAVETPKQKKGKKA